MGADLARENGNPDETPRRRVTISGDYYFGEYEVTQERWTGLMGYNPSQFKGRSNPVENVSWDMAQEFLGKLNQKEGTLRYRPPSEAEWERAARAGSETAYFWGDDANALEAFAWSGEDYDKGSSRPVGLKDPNPW
jgi:formylglycine-generating enzyme required for sulfatase activity